MADVAGGLQPGQRRRLEDTSDETYREVMALNLDYIFQVCRDVSAVMIAQGGGAIVNVSSVSGLRAAPFHGPYGAAKAALLALTKTMAIEWGEHRIKVNVVVPGAVASARAGDRIKVYETRAPLGRAADPQDVTNAILFLLSDLAAAIAGQDLVVDTGLTANRRCRKLRKRSRTWHGRRRDQGGGMKAGSTPGA